MDSGDALLLDETSIFFIESAHSMTTSVACVSWCWKVDQRSGGNCASDVLLLLQLATLLQLLQSPIQEKLRIAQDIVATFVHECRSDLRRGWHGELVSKDTASPHVRDDAARR